MGHWDLPEDKDLILTIKTAKWEEVENPITHKKDAKRVVRWVEDGYKPLICNQTNSQSIIKATGVNYMEDSGGCKVSLYIDSVMNHKEKEEVDCVRIRRKAVVLKKPTLTPDHKRWDDAKKSVQAGDADIESIRKNWEISDEHYNLLAS